MISIIISTKNRQFHIDRCLQSLFKNSFKDFEIIIGDQSNNDLTQEVVRKYNYFNLIYFKDHRVGKTKTINTAIKKSKGDIYSFIDDDNLVSKNWLFKINTFLSTNAQVDGVFGSILPYHPEAHHKLICPSIFYQNIQNVVKDPYIIHHQVLGLGSNMSLRKKIFKTIGGFKEWLGPGNLGIAGGEDGEIIYRILRSKFTLAFEPSVINYHNRWLTQHEYRILQGKYTAGEFAYMTYYIHSNDFNLIKLFLINVWNKLYSEGIKFHIKKLIKGKSDFNILLLVTEIGYSVGEALRIIHGIIIGMSMRCINRETF